MPVINCGGGILSWQGMIDPGYLGAMFNGFDCIASLLGQKTTVDTWFKVGVVQLTSLCSCKFGKALFVTLCNSEF